MFDSFKQRSSQTEWMDDPSTDFTTFAACLHDLEIVNILSFGYRPTLRWLRQIIQNTPPEKTISVIDIGSGGGDMLRKIANFAVRSNRKINLTGVDLNPWSARYAKSVTSHLLPISFETSDIFDFAPDRTFDYAISALFTHHLTEPQLVTFLQWMEQHTTKGWFINDLHRHPLAAILFKYLSRLLHLDKMVQHDGVVSVARAFTRTDWLRALTLAGIPVEQTSLRWCFPFRYVLARHKS